jgi:hypothetical protein
MKLNKLCRSWVVMLNKTGRASSVEVDLVLGATENFKILDYINDLSKK